MTQARETPSRRAGAARVRPAVAIASAYSSARSRARSSGGARAALSCETAIVGSGAYFQVREIERLGSKEASRQTPRGFAVSGGRGSPLRVEGGTQQLGDVGVAAVLRLFVRQARQLAGLRGIRARRE